jgi:hypothetical protein
VIFLLLGCAFAEGAEGFREYTLALEITADTTGADCRNGQATPDESEACCPTGFSFVGYGPAAGAVCVE